MALTFNQIKELLKMLRLTRTEELSCDQCLDKMAEFAEDELAGRSISESLVLVEHHLRLCCECQEEYKILLEGLKALK